MFELKRQTLIFIDVISLKCIDKFWNLYFFMDMSIYVLNTQYMCKSVLYEWLIHKGNFYLRSYDFLGFVHVLFLKVILFISFYFWIIFFSLLLEILCKVPDRHRAIKTSSNFWLLSDKSINQLNSKAFCFLVLVWSTANRHSVLSFSNRVGNNYKIREILKTKKKNTLSFICCLYF